MKNLNWTYIIISLILASGIVGYGLINYNQTKLATQEQQTNKVIKVITATTQPTITPTPTVIYKATTQTQPIVTAAEIGKELKAMYPAQYGKYSDEVIGEKYIAKYGNTPISQVLQRQTVIYEQPLAPVQQPQAPVVQQQTYPRNCISNTIGNYTYTNCN